MSPRFWPNKPTEQNLHHRGYFEDVCSFLIKHAHLSKFTVARTLFNNFKRFNKRGIFQAKRQLRRVFRRQFWETGHLLTMFCTRFSSLTRRANLRQNDVCAVWFGATFEHRESCSRRFSQALAFQQYGLIWSKTTVAQSVLTQSLSNRTIAHAVLHRAIESKTTVAQCELRPISSNSTVPHGVLKKV